MESTTMSQTLTPSQLVKRSERRLRWKLWASYTGDWLLTIALGGLFLALDQVTGFRRRFSLNDESIQYPYTLKERIPNSILIVLALVVPLVSMPIINLISVRTFWDLHNSELGLILALALAGSLTNIFKITVGRPRPDLIARCQPIAGAANSAVFGLVDQSICTQTNAKIMKDGWRSFASAHASLSFAGLGYLSLYIAGKMHLFDHRGHTSKSWAAVLPIFGAIVIGITRTMDYRHHWQDVIVGEILGGLAAYFSYRQYYPSLEHPLSHRPYSPRYSPLALVQTDSHPNDSGSGAGGVKGQEVPHGANEPTIQERPGDKGQGRDLESGNTDDNGNEIKRELHDTVPRQQPPTLERVWSDEDGHEHENDARRRKTTKSVRPSADTPPVLSA